MNRTFQTKVGRWYWCVIALTSALLFYLFWQHFVIAALAAMAAVVLLIEMLIHTQYVLTADDVLLIESGRFVPNVKIAVGDIKSVRKVRSAALFQPALSFSRLELTYETAGKIQSAQVSPKNTDDFIRCLRRKNPSIQQL